MRMRLRLGACSRGHAGATRSCARRSAWWSSAPRTSTSRCGSSCLRRSASGRTWTMADVGPVPDVDPVAAGQQRDADLAAIEAQLTGPNPHSMEMDLPAGLKDDGAY